MFFNEEDLINIQTVAFEDFVKKVYNEDPIDLPDEMRDALFQAFLFGFTVAESIHKVENGQNINFIPLN